MNDSSGHLQRNIKHRIDQISNKKGQIGLHSIIYKLSYPTHYKHIRQFNQIHAIN